MPGLVGHDGQYADVKFFAHYYHVCGLMLSSSIHDRTGERTVECACLSGWGKRMLKVDEAPQCLYRPS